MSTSREEKERTLTALYDAYADDIFRYVYYRVRSRDEALDIVQAVFTNLWRYIEAGKDIAYPKAFLYRSARNTLINAARDRREHLSLETLTEAGFQVAYTEADREELERQAEIIDRLQEMDAKYRDILVLRYVDGLRVSEIAELLGETANSISVKIHRGIAQLKKFYGKT